MDDYTSIPTAPWSGLGRKIESATRKALYDFGMLEGAEKIAIALSGGKDSLTLLFILQAISGRGFHPFDIVAVHVDGEYSCGAGVNKGYLQGICDSLEVPFIVRSSSQKLEELECYSCSRERRLLLFNAAKEAGATTIAFGHHRDDNAQTILMNMLHKGEFAALQPKIDMHDFGTTIIRPLIYVAESSIATFAKQQGYARVMCRCPVGQNSMRKQVDKMLEEWTQLFPNARANIAHAGLHYGSDKALRIKKR